MKLIIISAMTRTKLVALAAAALCQFVLVATSQAAGQLSPSPAHETINPDATLWYRQPARQWVEALPIGNGYMGAMVFGGIPQERIALNESTFWAGCSA